MRKLLVSLILILTFQLWIVPTAWGAKQTKMPHISTQRIGDMRIGYLQGNTNIYINAQTKKRLPMEYRLLVNHRTYQVRVKRATIHRQSRVSAEIINNNRKVTLKQAGTLRTNHRKKQLRLSIPLRVLDRDISQSVMTKLIFKQNDKRFSITNIGMDTQPFLLLGLVAVFGVIQWGIKKWSA